MKWHDIDLMTQHKMTQEMAICDWMAVILFTTRLTNILMWLDGFAIDNSGLFYVYNRTHQDFSHISRLLLQLPINLLLIRVCSVCCLSSTSTAKCCHNLWQILILCATHKCFCQNGRSHIVSAAMFNMPGLVRMLTNPYLTNCKN